MILYNHIYIYIYALYGRKFHNWWRQRSHRAVTRDLSKPHMAWEQDYHLQDPGRLALFDEYLEMSNYYVINYQSILFSIYISLSKLQTSKGNSYQS